MREDIMNVLEIPEMVGVNGKPLVVLIDRGSNRNIQNSNPLAEVMEKGFPRCAVQTVRLQDMDVNAQIDLIAKASVLVGIHGSGLVHTVWMAESRENHTTHLVEIVPYQYTCRNWYETAASVAGVKYHRIMNKNPPENVTVEALLGRPNDMRNSCMPRLAQRPADYTRTRHILRNVGGNS